MSLGGETVYPNDVYQFQRKLSQATALCTTGATIETWFYGCTFFQTPFPDGVDEIPMGFIHPECRVEVRDDQGGKLPPGQTGEITVRSECLSPGYWKRAELNAAKYVVGEDQKRYFHSAIWEPLARMDCSIRKADPTFKSRSGGCGSTSPVSKQFYTITPESNKPWSWGEPGRTTRWNWSPISSQLGHRTTGRSEIYQFLATTYCPTKFPRASFFSSPFPSPTRTRWTEMRFLIRTKSK